MRNTFHPTGGGETRREFLRKAARGAAFLAVAGGAGSTVVPVVAQDSGRSLQPWYRRALRWGQTNIVESDPLRYDIAWWREHWRNTRVQGVVINGGGIVCYYPSQVPYHRRAEHLGDRDLLGELVAAARAEGLAVFARMDSHRAQKELYEAHPDWFAHDAEGKPYMSTGLYIACVNSPFYRERIPAILREIATGYGPDGFTDNNWNGPMRHQPCFCLHCQRSFRSRTGQSIPEVVDWNSPLYREWILWNYERRLEIWDQFNAVTTEAGGSECLWVGMMAGSQNWQARVFRDDREVYRRSPIIMLDDQRRFDDEGFMHNAEIGKRIRSVGGWDKVIPESMAMYHLTDYNFRHAAKPPAEVRMWMVEGFAGGVQPWWHHVGADQQDRRMLQTAKPLMDWHSANERYLVDRRPIAPVGLLWSQRNMDFFGRDEGGALVDEPWNGFGQAMVRDRIPYVPLHVDDIGRESQSVRLLILPNLGAVSDSQAAMVRTFVERGGSLLATGASSLFDEWGDPRPDFALADLFGARAPADHPWRDEATRLAWAKGWEHTYLRLTPELRNTAYGPRSADAPEPPSGRRHPTLAGFEETDIVAFGGMLAPLRVDAGVVTPLSFVPPSPVSPAEAVYMRQPVTDIPGVVLSERPSGGRIAYLPADLDRRFARENLPDHGDLLAKLIRWTLRDSLPIRVQGVGLIDCHLYRQERNLVLHLSNLTSAGTWRTPVHELIEVGPFQVAVELPLGIRGKTLDSLVLGERYRSRVSAGWVTFTVPGIRDHEVIVIS